MPHKNPEERKAYFAAYRAANKERVMAYKKAYLDRHPERRAASVAASNANPKTRERKTAYRERSRDALRAAGRAYCKNNRDQANAGQARYRAAKLRATPSWADQAAIKAVYTEAKRLSESGIPHHVDHIYPLVSDWVCGLHVEWNLQVIPAQENRKKGNRKCL